MTRKELEELPTTRPGDRVLRRRRSPRGIRQILSRFFKHKK